MMDEGNAILIVTKLINLNYYRKDKLILILSNKRAIISVTKKMKKRKKEKI